MLFYDTVRPPPRLGSHFTRKEKNALKKRVKKKRVEVKHSKCNRNAAPTPPAEVWFFWNNFFYGSFLWGELRNSPQPRLGIAPPARLGGAMRRCDKNPLPGRMPLGRRADGAPSHRITKPTSRLARERQEIEPGSSTLIPRTVPDAPRECGVPTPPRSPFRLLSSLALSRAWPFAVAKATQVCKAAQPRSSEKNAASRAGQTPCTR